jgi:hypothetical protein
MTASWLSAVNRQMLPSIFYLFYYLKSASLSSSNLRKSRQMADKQRFLMAVNNFSSERRLPPPA